MYDLIIIGAGAAGSLAAGFASAKGKRVLLLDKNPRIGKKLLITGKGRCNLTNASDVKEHIENCPVNGKFITNALYRFTPKDVMDFFSSLGVNYKVERGNRVFPESDKAEDIVIALEKFIKKNHVEFRQHEVQNFAKIAEKFTVLTTSGDKYQSHKLLIATGGKSYPATGSTGDGYKFAKKMGHTINLLTPSLVPIETEEEWIKKIQGLSLKNISIKILNKNDKVQYEDFGEMLFTHYGVSGPVILSASSHLRVINRLTLEIDLKPALDENTLDKRLLRDISNNSNKHYHNLLKNLLPQKMIPIFVELTKIPEDKPANSITKEERKRLLHLLKHFRLTLSRFRPLKEAIITSGGVMVDEIDPKTMESKIEPGLYFAGEVIDVDAYTGGFNLQIAFSTAFTVADSI